MLTPGETIVFDAIKKDLRSVPYGTWKVELVIHAGEIVGYNEIEKPLKQFRVTTEKKG